MNITLDFINKNNRNSFKAKPIVQVKVQIN